MTFLTTHTFLSFSPSPTILIFHVSPHTWNTKLPCTVYEYNEREEEKMHGLSRFTPRQTDHWTWSCPLWARISVHVREFSKSGLRLLKFEYVLISFGPSWVGSRLCERRRVVQGCGKLVVTFLVREGVVVVMYQSDSKNIGLCLGSTLVWIAWFRF